MKSEEICYLPLTVTYLIFISVNYLYYMKDVLHEIFQYEGTDAGEDRKQSFCLGSFFSHFSLFGFWCFPKVFWVLNEVG